MSELPPECSRLAAELRTCRGLAGLTLAALAAKSPYSKSSWHRYLNGATLPPWPAVQALCDLANVPSARLRALWELADAAWSRRSAQTPAAVTATEPSVVREGQRPTIVDRVPPTGEEPVAPPGPRDRRLYPRPALRAFAVVVLVLASAFSATAVAERLRGPASAAPSVAPTSSGFHVGCTAGRCDGKDPGTMGCGVEPQTLLQQQTASGAGIAVRFNPSCHAVWARMWNTHRGDVLTLTVPREPVQRASTSAGSELGWVYTPLVGSPRKGVVITACLTSRSPDSSGCFSTTMP